MKWSSIVHNKSHQGYISYKRLIKHTLFHLVNWCLGLHILHEIIFKGVIEFKVIYYSAIMILFYACTDTIY